MNFKKLILAPLALSLFCTSPLQASEIDSFNKRYSPLKDSLEILNQTANEQFQGALDKANKRGKCSEKRLYKKLRKVFNNHYLGSFSKFVIKSDLVEKIETPVTESIYKDFDAFIPGFYARVIQDPSGLILKVNGHMIGTDKFEHFSGSGYRYFKTYYVEGKEIKDALNIGWKAETGYLGSVTTGVMSYADLTANFNGMRFWNHILQKHDDVLGTEYNIGPYVACKDDKWVQVKSLNWADYIDDAFDEGTNCNKYRTKEMRRQVDAHIKDMEKDGQSYACPIVKSSIPHLEKKYGKLAKSLLNFRKDLSIEEETEQRERRAKIERVNRILESIKKHNNH